MLKDPGRYAYLPLIRRPKIEWPNGARMAFWVAPNIEYYELMPPGPFWPRPAPDMLNYSHRDYGNRAGVWRVMEVMAKFGVRASVSLNAAVCDHLPDVIHACKQLQWELFSHGIYNTRTIYGMDHDQIRELLRDSIETIARAGGQDVHGFLAPAVSSTEDFFDLLPEFGIRYTVDMVPDDQPVPINTTQGRLVAVPYSTDINDVRVMGVRGYPPDKWAAMVKAAFDQLYEEGAENGTVLCVPLHPFIVGQPHRIAALADILQYVTSHDRVWLATAREIADWYYLHYYDVVSAFMTSKKGAAG